LDGVMKNPGNEASANRRQGETAQQLLVKTWQFSCIFYEACAPAYYIYI
jgi:hypothetical protein